MANLLPNDQQLYERIKDENISIHPFVWDTLYFYLGDYISGINLIASYYIEKNDPISVDDGRKILEYTRTLNGIIEKLLHHEKIDKEGLRLERIKNEQMDLHPVVRELVTHYISNDIQAINFIVSFYLDPAGEEPIPVENSQKILKSTLSMRDFLDKLRKATQKDIGD